MVFVIVDDVLEDSEFAGGPCQLPSPAAPKRGKRSPKCVPLSMNIV